MLLPPPQATIAEAARINTTAIPKARRHVRLRMRGASTTIIKRRNAATVTGRRNCRPGSKKYAGRIEFAVVVTVTVTLSVALELRRSEEHTSELQSRLHLVCRLLLEKKNNHPGAGRATR